jgi:cytochrome b561
VQLRDTPERWGSVTQLLHWSVAALILALIALGWNARLAALSPAKITLFYWHKSLGMLALVLVLIRLGWRAGNRPPSIMGEFSRREMVLARSAHIALYVLILAVPISGWLINSASGIPFRVFWIVPLPAIVPISGPLEQIFKLTHLATSWALAILIVGHVGAALRHHFVLGNRVLTRMLPQSRRRTR